MPDLGADKIRAYRFDQDKKEPLTEIPFTQTVPGSGPRHFAFHPNGKFAYCIEEMGGAVKCLYPMKKESWIICRELIPIQISIKKDLKAPIFIFPRMVAICMHRIVGKKIILPYFLFRRMVRSKQ